MSKPCSNCNPSQRNLDAPQLAKEAIPANEIRTFDTGATRDTEEGKLDYEGFLSPLALHRYAQYMHKHREQSDGKMRASDNWQKGIPIGAYMKSLWRHLVDLWTLHRDYEIMFPLREIDDKKEEALCAIIFNASGYLHEHLKAKGDRQQAYAEDSEAQEKDKNWLGLQERLQDNPCTKEYK